MTPLEPRRLVPLATELALSLAVGLATFTVVAVILAATDLVVVTVAVGVVGFGGGAAAVALRGHVAYAVPAAIAALLAFDWYRIPPTHDHGFPSVADLAALAAYVGVGAVIGVLASEERRAAHASEEARAELAGEQAALRRVATLVARHADPGEVFAAIAAEVGELLGVDATHIGRFEAGDRVTGVGSWSRSGDHVPLGTTIAVGGENVTAAVHRTGEPARLDSYSGATGAVADVLRGVGIHASVGAPIVVDDRLWGVMVASSKRGGALPDGTETRICKFTDLAATAISNAEAWTATRELADEQTALRRVATLVARGAPAAELFATVTREVGRLLDVDLAGLMRYDGDGVTVVASWSAAGEHPTVGDRWPAGAGPLAAAIARTGEPARIDDWRDVPGVVAAQVRERLGARSSVGTPIVVEGRLWGALTVHSRRAGGLPADAEARLVRFTELVATAISNAESRVALAASRARVVAEADRERARVVGDLHDGAQQRLIHTVVTLKLARRALARREAAEPLVAEALGHAEQATRELRDLAHGILPVVLTRGGLRAAVDALATRTHVPVGNEVQLERLPAPVESAAYFVVAEALTNIAKHARAEHAVVRARVVDGELELEVVDDGVGGARPDGRGLVRLTDRVASLNGALRVVTPAAGGTAIVATIPLDPD